MHFSPSLVPHISGSDSANIYINTKRHRRSSSIVKTSIVILRSSFGETIKCIVIEF